jgi:pyridoxine/pyridoxamine 5'-phosphate oxidase
MDKAKIYDFLRQHKLAVVSSVSASGASQSAVVGIAVTEELEIVFDTLNRSRKYANMIQNPNVSLVIGWDDETSVQYEGVAELLTGNAAGAYLETYYRVYPDGRERAETWKGLVHFKVTPTWLRYSNFNEPVTIEEIAF